MSGSESSESARVEQLTRENETLRRQLEKAQAEIERLRKELEEALRSLKRQAAPLSRGKRKKRDRKRPGRKSGADYGKRVSRPVPERVDEEIPVPLPKQSECCRAQTLYDETQSQFQEDIVKQTIVRRFDIQIGHCACCGKRVQGRHRLQTSDALGAAQVQIGPQAIALSAHLNKELGISHERVGRVLKSLWQGCSSFLERRASWLLAAISRIIFATSSGDMPDLLKALKGDVPAVTRRA